MYVLFVGTFNAVNDDLKKYLSCCNENCLSTFNM